MSEGHFMDEAFAEALRAGEAGEYPVGAVVVRDQEIVGRGHNAQTRLCDPTAHAEVLAIRAACEALGERKLPGCALYTTLEPCPMCRGAVIEAEIARVVFGGRLFSWIRDVKFGSEPFELLGPVDERGRALFEERLRQKGRHEVLEHERSRDG